MNGAVSLPAPLDSASVEHWHTAAGRNTAGLPRCAEGYSSGMSIGDATFFGHLAGVSGAGRCLT